MRARARTAPRHSDLELLIGLEPAKLRGDLRALLGERPSGAPEAIARRLSDRQWRRWRPALVEHGASAASFRALVFEYRREVWLWVIGDRSWEQMMAGLVGRCQRRFDVGGHRV